MPGDFDIYDAFDECGNPPIHLWTRYLRVNIPVNWFAMFEEAKRRQRDWSIQQHQLRRSLIIQQQQDETNYSYYTSPPPPLPPPQQQVDEQVVSNSGYSNTDVSSMQLNRPSVTSLVASTNIVDPSLQLEQKSPSLIHHRSKEYVTHTPSEEIHTPTTFDTDLDFPHDSDQFSIRSDIVVKKDSADVKKMIFG